MPSAWPILPSPAPSESPSDFNRYPRSLMGSIAPPEIVSGENPEAIMLWAHSKFPRLALVASMHAESSVLIDMASRAGIGVTVITLGTGRRPQESDDLIDRVRDRSGMR